MQLSKRERQLIEVFIKQGTTLTAQEIAGFCDISTKTVYRTIRKINEASLEGDIIISSSGKGFDLIYDRYLEQVVENNGIRTAASEPLSRRNNIIVSLLFRSPKRIRIDEAFGAYFVSDSVISNDLSRIESFLKQNDLNLIRNGKYISIEGHEKTIRKVVNMLISSNDLIDDQFTTVEHQISPVDINFITSLLEKLEACFEGGIPYPYKMNILSHIYILVKRFRDGGRPRESEDGFLDEEEQKLTEDYKEFYHISKKFIQKIENYLCTSLPDIEIFYLFQYLISSRIAGQSILTPISGDLIKEVTGFFSLEAGRNIGIQQLGEINKKDLYKHM